MVSYLDPWLTVARRHQLLRLIKAHRLDPIGYLQNMRKQHITNLIHHIISVISLGRNVNDLLRFKMFSNTCCGVSSLNGGIPVINSKRQTPSDHQSTAAPCFWLEKKRIIYIIMGLSLD